MNYLTKEELRRLFRVAHERNRLHHLCMVTMFFSGLRVSEAIAIQGTDVCDGQLSVRRLKKSRPTMHDVKRSSDPLFDQTPLIEMARKNPGRMFPFSRQRVDQFVRRYGSIAGLHPAKCHSHAFKHSICMLLWAETHDLNAVQDHVGHKEASSTLVYMRQDSVAKARQVVAGLAI